MSSNTAPRRKSVLDLTGRVFGYLTVERFANVTRHRHARWWCKCYCGALSLARATDLKTGRKKSCGCMQGNHR